MKMKNGGKNKINWIRLRSKYNRRRSQKYKKQKNQQFKLMIINSKIHMFTIKEMPIWKNIFVLY